MGLLLQGQVAVVTGGARGIGEGIAAVFAKNGADVAIIDMEGAESAALRLEQLGVKSIGIRFDVRDIKNIRKTVDKVGGELGPIDIWVNNAGIADTMDIIDLNEEDWDKMLGTNLKGLVFCCREVFEKMRERQKGKIINIASMSGQRGAFYAGVDYSASKGGVIAATKTLALQMAPYHIHVNAIAPGLIQTRMAEELGFVNHINQIPLKRLGTPEDIGKAALFLASELSDYMTGQVLSVNGGLFMG